jgi:phospholipid/cholesterol/gamma-HCH transport system ATP-binding protein
MIRVRDFSKSFNKKVVHRNVNFTVNDGECWGLIGGSGTGKSVILRSLIGLEKPDTGKIYIDNQDITKFKEHDLIQIRKKVAYVFQGGALFDSLSIYENLAYPLREHTLLNEAEIKLKITTTLNEFGLKDNHHLAPSQLSGGMQKRVGLARAMVLDPDVLLYDEPTAGLDPFNTKRIQDLILKLKSKGVTSILVTHDMPVALAVCDKLALLNHGEIGEELTPKEFHSKTSSLMKKFINGENF